jgi:adenosylcobinamide-phosphate synthase
MKDQRTFTLGLALLMDMLWGDPPNRWHPVAWIGQGIAWAEQHAPTRSSFWAFLYGLGLACSGGLTLGSIGRVLEKALERIPLLGLLPQAWLLKTAFAGRSLALAAGKVQWALEHRDLDEGRRLVSWHLVSRDTTSLGAEHVAAATIESVAENTGDGFVAPVFYYALFGLPGAWAYRFLNTADAMLGYHDEKHEWLGKAAARLDDVANFIPARLTALLFLAAARLTGEDAQRGWAIWRRDAGKTASPNAGHPMSAMAGVLGVELEKKGVYRLGEGLPLPEPADIARSVRLMWWAAGLAAVLATAAAFAKSRRKV